MKTLSHAPLVSAMVATICDKTERSWGGLVSRKCIGPEVRQVLVLLLYGLGQLA